MLLLRQCAANKRILPAMRRCYRAPSGASIRIPDLKTDNVPASLIPPITDSTEAADILTRFFKSHAGRVLVLTGAGISTDSGVPDYRGEQGTYITNPEHRPIFYPEFISSEDFRKRYWARGYLGWSQMANARPNPSHYAITWLVERGYIQHVVTQNVDRFHHKAGGTDDKFTELHGTLYFVECLDCKATVDRVHYQHRIHARNPAWAAYQQKLVRTGEKPQTNPDGDVELPSNVNYTDFDIPPCQSCGSRLMKPLVVFFGEHVNPKKSIVAEQSVQDASAVLVIGSSLATYSSYRLVRLANDQSKPIVILNKGPTRADPLALSRLHVGCTPVLEQVRMQLENI